MPGQQGLRRHDRGHLRQKPATEPFRLGRQTTPLVVVEPKPPATKLFFEDPILFTKIVEGELLLLIHPATEISKNRNGSRTLCAFKANCRERRATVGNHCRFMQIQFPDHTRSGLRRNGRACSCKEHTWLPSSRPKRTLTAVPAGTRGDRDGSRPRPRPSRPSRLAGCGERGGFRLTRGDALKPREMPKPARPWLTPYRPRNRA